MRPYSLSNGSKNVGPKCYRNDPSIRSEETGANLKRVVATGTTSFRITAHLDRTIKIEHRSAFFSGAKAESARRRNWRASVSHYIDTMPAIGQALIRAATNGRRPQRYLRAPY
jgi:hypothetical protein